MTTKLTAALALCTAMATAAAQAEDQAELQLMFVQTAAGIEVDTAAQTLRLKDQWQVGDRPGMFILSRICPLDRFLDARILSCA